MRFFFVLVSAVCAAASLSATVLLPADFRQIVTGSQIIVHGRITDVRAEWIDGRREVESSVTVEPSSFLRGTPTANVTFRVPGGQIGRYRRVTVGAPQFEVGEEVVLFLKANGPAVPQVFGLNQGVFRVRVDERTGTRMVTMPILMSSGTAAQKVTRGDPGRRPLALDQFAATVRAALQQGGAR